MESDKITKDSILFKAVNGKYYTSMEEVQTVNDAYWQYKNPMIIDKDSVLFCASLSPELLLQQIIVV